MERQQTFCDLPLTTQDGPQPYAENDSHTPTNITLNFNYSTDCRCRMHQLNANLKHPNEVTEFTINNTARNTLLDHSIFHEIPTKEIDLIRHVGFPATKTRRNCGHQFVSRSSACQISCQAPQIQME